MAAKKQKRRQPARRPRATPAPDRPVSQATAQPADSRAKAAGPGLPVVGIGASAGGLESLKRFLSAMPADSGMAFILVPHLDPTHESLMAELLGRYTSMPVVQIDDDMRALANRVYVIPPNKYLTMSAGALRLTGPVERRAYQTPIDFFLRSLAEDQQERAICIIMSGTGAHGTLGLKAIKANGGMAIVQDPKSADYDQMPANAIDTGLADYVLPPEKMPEALISYGRHAYVSHRPEPEIDDELPDGFNRVMTLVRARTKHDFRCYRKRMLLRRIERRMGLNRIDKLDDYAALLRENADELKNLVRDLLISVTTFFRDPEAYQALETMVIADLARGKNSDGTVRAWVSGCATGEEAYSLAILLLEHFVAAQKNCKLQIFATDVDEQALEVARHGIYPDSVVADISPERVARYFTRAGDHAFQVNKLLRESVVFAAQDLISDAPFSKLDLISCRNLLIYLEPDAQKKVISLFHFSLAEDGYLFLGPSETVGRHTDLFEPLSKKWRIYRRLGPSRPERVEFPIAQVMAPRLRERPQPESPAQARRVNYVELTQRLLLEEMPKAAALINRNFEVLYFHGVTARYLDQPTGEPTHDILALAREGLRTKLRSVIHRAVNERETAVSGGIRVKRNGGYANVRVTAKPVQAPRGAEGLILVVFEDEAGAESPRGLSKSDAAEERLVQQLENELHATREDLQSTIEELESSNEELKASNEEVMSMNEELQSANEELETSKEELQSLNEELSTVNNQLQDKLEELERANNDLGNLFVSTDVATVFLDASLHIKRYTPATAKLFNLIVTDLGRPIGDIAPKFTDPDLVQDCETVLTHLSACEKEVQTKEGQWCVRRIAPYLAADNKIEGVVITFGDVTRLKVELERRQRLLAAVLLTSNDAVMVYDFEGKIIVWNRGAEANYGYTLDEALTMNVEQIIPEGLRGEARAARDQLRRGIPIKDHETQRIAKNGEIREVFLTTSVVHNEAGVPIGVAASEHDVTILRQANLELETANEQLRRDFDIQQRSQAALESSESRFRSMAESAQEAIISTDGKGLITYFNPAAERIFGFTESEAVGKPATLLMPDRFHQAFKQGLSRFLTTGEGRMVGQTAEHMAQGKGGGEFPVELSLSVAPTADGPAFTAIIRDIRERKKLQREILDIAAAEQRRLGQDLHDGIGQELTAIGLMVESLVETLSAHPPEVEKARKIGAGVRRVMSEARALSRGLMPVESDATGLMTALTDTAARISEQGVVKCAFYCPKPVLVENNVTATHLFRIAQEAVTNALKHGKAKKIDIELRQHDGHVLLQVRDNGKGIDTSGIAGPGLGLKTMRYRANLINAVLTIDPNNGGGAAMTCVVPVEK